MLTRISSPSFLGKGPGVRFTKRASESPNYILISRATRLVYNGIHPAWA